MRHTLLILAVAALLVPTAASTWRAGGTHEPDTSYDTPTWMWQEAPPPGSKRIYFNVMTLTGTANGFTPNVALLETQNEPPTVERHFGLLGVWADCNGDGYIGYGEHAIREYPASLLVSESVCPATSGPANTWVSGAHNYNGWVSEFLHIGRTGSQRMYPDPQAMVWGDYHRPDEKPFHRSCALQPLPRGTTQTTGGALDYIGCRAEQRGVYILTSFNTAVDLIGDPLGLRFADESDGDSGTLGRIGTFGDDSQEYSPAYVWDCSQPMTPVGPARIGRLDPRLGNPNPTQWSVAGFFNHTRDGLYPDNCDWTDDRSGGFYPEDDFLGVDPKNKTQADWNFRFAAGGRGGPGASLISGGGAGAANDLGLTWGAHTGWSGDSVFIKQGPRLLRVDLGNPGPAPAYWLTFYANVGSDTLARGFERTTGEGKYGSWHCGSHTTGIHNGWNCDVNTWYRNLDGSPMPPEGQYKLATPGDPYMFRDVDCYDGSNALGIATSLPAYGSDACT